MVIFITFINNWFIPIALPWLLATMAILSGEFRQASQLLLDALVTPVRLLAAYIKPKPIPTYMLRLQQNLGRESA